MRTIKTQLGKAFGADFGENTWTFLMPDGFEVAAGDFYIVDKPVYDELLEALQSALLALEPLATRTPPEWEKEGCVYLFQKAKNAIEKATGKKEEAA